MSLQETKDQLLSLLEDADNKVIALSGKWGTGKSHLWQEIRKADTRESVRKSLYVSLFGLKELDDVKMKLVQSSIPAITENAVLAQRVKLAFEGIKKVAAGFHKAFSALDELTLLALPTMLKGKLIVLDDIERKHNELSADQVLGFIDEYIQQHDTRFVVILNTDKLQMKEVWENLREKVIDQEITLNTSCDEAFRIAAELTPATYSAQVKSASETCRLTNIRVIRKVIKAVNRIVGGRNNLHPAVLARVIPSIVILAAINYKALEDGPDFDFVLAQGTVRDWRPKNEKKATDFDEEADESAESKDEKRKSAWKLMLNQLGIIMCDEFELLVVEFLRSGMFDATALNAILDRYVTETDVMIAIERARQFGTRLLWNHHTTEGKLLEEAKALAADMRFLDPYHVTSLANQVGELPDGAAVADEIIATWIEHFNAKNDDEISDHDPFNRPLHHLIRAASDAKNATAQPGMSVVDACRHIVENSGWGVRQEVAMKSATVADFEAALRTTEGEDLRRFMSKMIEFRLQRSNYQQSFGSAMDNFVEACRNIRLNPASPRLGNLIQNVFEKSSLGRELATHPDAGVGATTAVASPAIPAARESAA